jgi:hypothetical protein
MFLKINRMMTNNPENSNTWAALKTQYKRILVTHAQTGMCEYAVHSNWDATESYMQRMSDLHKRRSRIPTTAELEAVSKKVIKEKADLVIIVGGAISIKRKHHRPLHDPATVIHQMTQIPVVNIEA